MIDYLVIGGGIIGSFLTRELAQYDRSVTMLEKEADVAQVQTTHNSALVHSPVIITPNKGELKARFALEGSRMFPEIVDKLDVPALKDGALLLAMDEKQMKKAKKLAQMAKARGIEEVRVLSGEEMRAVEPNLTDNIVGGLDMYSAMIVDTYDLVKKVTDNARYNGASIHTGEEVIDIVPLKEGFEVHTKANVYHARSVINAAGIKNAHIAGMLEVGVPYAMKPRRGEYYILKPDEGDVITKKTLFPLPGETTKGVLITPQPDGTVRLGPSSQPQDSTDEAPVTEAGLESVKKDVADRIKHIPYDTVTSTYAGVRSSIDQKDFYIARSHEHPNFIHVAGTDSPGVPAAPAIARYVSEQIIKPRDPIVKKPEADPFKRN